ncbi:lantibiotic immunity ABC transporter MutE/EpiE family permease subunit [uncultured Enterococcus sp.]|uniref:lantibiotic immunity ABC transporter MutE/EpiE family permease subunit n=1 Tax=uncultured Enterococcus sp. TaxID=167972 RepID=UPI002594C31D|nr:lantibiotic immunity ABC transporter MutE/EpiE family permease subunit [uncultured Enterococcus sp.]
MMRHLVKAEWLKGRRKGVRTFIWLFPIVCTLLAVVLMGGLNTQMGIFNWWYMLVLPACLALIAIDVVVIDKQVQFLPILLLPFEPRKTMTAKVILGCSYLLVANLIIGGLAMMVGFGFEQQYSVGTILLATLVMTLTMCWQIPLGIYLTVRFQAIASFLLLFGLNVFFSSQSFSGTKFWWIPFSITARLMAPILGLNPNGLALDVTSPLSNRNVLLPGILITVCLFVGEVVVLQNRFFRKEQMV